MEPAGSLKRSPELGFAIPGILWNGAIDGLANQGGDGHTTSSCLRAQPAHLVLGQ